MHVSIKRTALSLCLVTALATPAWASDSAPVTDIRPINAVPISAPIIAVPISAPINVVPISAPIDLAWLTNLPMGLTVNGQAVTFDQAPVMNDEVLYIPVRFIAEAAGAEVTWDEGMQLVHIKMPDRTIILRIGKGDAEMHLDGVQYVQRNLVQMAKAPLLLGGRTLVSADALTAVFGFEVQLGAGGALTLTAPAKGSKADVWAVEPGTIKEVQTGERNRILIAGKPMSNGEGSLNWATIKDETVVTVKEGEATRAGTFADLAVGAEIEVSWTGPMLRSYPGQGTAAEVVVFVK
ncbi:MAG: hypothetical protein K0R39_1860 [Symbiobacteriaceae bacterium]|jgi:hypothetical protein|nr:hypothetical protein [Symbiobacteriaceae bacterium]